MSERDRIAQLTATLQAMAGGDFGAALEQHGGSGALAEVERAVARLQEALRRDRDESNIAISSLATANVRLMLWNEALQKINHADSILYHGGEITSFYERIVADAMEMTRARYGALAVLDDKGELADFVTRGMAAQEIAAIGRRPQGKGLLGAMFVEHGPVRVADIAADPRACGFPPGHPPMKTLLGVPLRIRDRLMGVIYLANKEQGEMFGEHGERLEDSFTEDDEIMLGLFADYLVRALERIELMRQLQASNRELARRGDQQQELITKLHEAQDQLLQSEKMASIGQLAAGVAHEINNPVGFVNSNVGTLERYLTSLFSILVAYEKAEAEFGDHPHCEAIRSLKQELDYDYLKDDIASLIQETKDGVARVRKIVRDLKDFSHVDDAEWQHADLRKGLDSTLNVVWNELKYKAEVVKEYGDIPTIECLPGQLNQVFMNLLVNAAHAIAERGTIAVRTGTEEGGVWVEIADTGCGIPPENMSRIFDPFFTTKPVGKGTGLGLSLSYGIVQKHHGSIEVRSEIGQGTAFRVHLPTAQPEGENEGQWAK